MADDGAVTQTTMRHWARRLRGLSSSGAMANLARGAGLVLALHGFGKAVKYGVQALLARWLGAGAYGTYAFALAWAELLAPVAALGFATGVLRFIPAYLVQKEWSLLRGLIRRSRQITLGIGALIAILAAGILVLAQPADINLRALILGFWILPFLAVVNLQMQIIRGTQDMLWAYGLPLLAQPLLIGLVAFVLYQGGWLSGLTALWSALIAVLIVMAAQAIAIRVRMPMEALSAKWQYATQEWLLVSLHLLIVASAVMVQNRMDTLLVGLIYGERQAGIYSVAFTTATLVSFFLTALNGIAAPLIADLYAREDLDALQSMFRQLFSWMSLVAIGAGGFLILFGRAVLNIFGPAFVEGYPILVILAIGQVVSVIAGPVGYLMNLTGHQRLSARAFAVSALVNMTITAILLPWAGRIGAAIGTTLALIFQNVWLAWLIRRHIGIDTFFFLMRPRRRRPEA